jgi:hypothetical protein
MVEFEGEGKIGREGLVLEDKSDVVVEERSLERGSH